MMELIKHKGRVEGEKGGGHLDFTKKGSDH